MQLSLDIPNNEMERPSGPLRPFVFRRFKGHLAAKTFIVKHHYSHNCPTGKNYFYGAWVDGDLYAVACYGVGANMDGGKWFAEKTGLPVTRENHVTLKRLCRVGPKGKAEIAMTKFLSLCHKALKREFKVRFIISYADPAEHGRTAAPVPRITEWQAGGIYAAANFKYLGKVPPERHFKDENGGFVHRRVPYRLMQRTNAKAGRKVMTMPEAQKQKRLTPWTIDFHKERWFLDLGLPKPKPKPGTWKHG